MAHFLSDDSIYNLTGAVIFTAYVISALLISIFLIYNLIRTYFSRQSWAPKDGAQMRIQIFTALSALSFSVLSYHMLNYLILSYQEWAEERKIDVPQHLYGRNGVFGSQEQRVLVHVWSWLTTSTLFQNFAETICSNNVRFWWTQQALLVTMAWSVYMSVEGQRRQISHLWAYAFISQILPVSFAQNLFFVAVLLTPIANPGEPVMVPPLKYQFYPLAAYILLVLVVPYTIGTAVFVGMVISIRLLLLCPVLLLTILPESYREKKITRQHMHGAYEVVYQGLAISFTFLVCGHFIVAYTMSGGSFRDIFGAINSDPSVSALGHDYLLSLVSSAVWRVEAGSLVGLDSGA